MDLHWRVFPAYTRHIHTLCISNVRFIACHILFLYVFIYSIWYNRKICYFITFNYYCHTYQQVSNNLKTLISPLKHHTWNKLETNTQRAQTFTKAAHNSDMASWWVIRALADWTLLPVPECIMIYFELHTYMTIYWSLSSPQFK